MIKLPVNTNWTQPNNSDRLGSLAYTKNINLDEQGYIKLSPRAISLFDSSGNVTNISDEDFNYLSAIGRSDYGTMNLVTADEPFNLTINSNTKDIAEDTATDNPNCDATSHGIWWQNCWYVSTNTTISYKDINGDWTADAIGSLTSGKRHYMAVFDDSSLLVTDGNTVKKYNTSHALTVTLTLPADYEAIALAYNGGKVGIITRLGSDTSGENKNCKFFPWDGSTTSASGYDLGAYTSVSIIPYKSSFATLTSEGQILGWNGGGFTELASFPFFYKDKRWGNLLNYLTYGNPMIVDGDVIYLNVGFTLDGTGKKQEYPLVGNPSGIWCYDPKVGLYHRWSPSISKAYFHTITSANVNLTTNTFTTLSPIPPAGSPIRLTSGTVGGLILGETYYIIYINSTKFKIALTKDDAINGVAIDITSASDNNYFWTYDLIDYGSSYSTISGALSLWGYSTLYSKDLIFGSYQQNTSLAGVRNLCSIVPFLENRGYGVTTKIFTNSVSDNIQKLYIKHRPLDTDDAIVVKFKNRDIFNIPTYAPNAITNDEFIWTNSTSGYTSTDLSEVKTSFDNGHDMEFEILSGAGAGQMVKITSITYLSGIYTLGFEDTIIGASVGLKSNFVVENWKVLDLVTYSTQTENGVFEIPIGLENGDSKWYQFKIELRGYETTIEELLIINQTQKPSL